jgi:hypothetical protein
VFEFWARVEGSCAFVRVLRRGIEWSLPDEGSGVEVIPMTSVIAVSSESGKFQSTLLVEAEERNVEFRVDNALAHEARALIRLLIAVFGREPAPRVPMPAAS